MVAKIVRGKELKCVEGSGKKKVEGILMRILETI